MYPTPNEEKSQTTEPTEHSDDADKRRVYPTPNTEKSPKSTDRRATQKPTEVEADNAPDLGEDVDDADRIEQAHWETFPASDPPSFNPSTSS